LSLTKTLAAQNPFSCSVSRLETNREEGVGKVKEKRRLSTINKEMDLMAMCDRLNLETLCVCVRERER